jgi:hypothetical protein
MDGGRTEDEQRMNRGWAEDEHKKNRVNRGWIGRIRERINRASENFGGEQSMLHED